jgi:hypothetical protein
MGADSTGTTITTKTVHFSVYRVWRLGRFNIIWVNVQSNVQSWSYNKRHKWCGVTMKIVLSILRSMKLYHCILRNKKVLTFGYNWRMLFLTKKISQFLFLAVEDILVLYPSSPPPPPPSPYKTGKQSHASIRKKFIHISSSQLQLYSHQ